ncbi:unnamed protein product [Zymoseptoria tritici ST99CH_3D1]|nr:unnamed protein product [Zymoseptoria tritici ST99CH_3D1]
MAMCPFPSTTATSSSDNSSIADHHTSTITSVTIPLHSVKPLPPTFATGYVFHACDANHILAVVTSKATAKNSNIPIIIIIRGLSTQQVDSVHANTSTDRQIKNHSHIPQIEISPSPGVAGNGRCFGKEGRMQQFQDGEVEEG